MLQWFLRFSEFPEFTEFNESFAPFRENSIFSIHTSVISKINWIQCLFYSIEESPIFCQYSLQRRTILGAIIAFFKNVDPDLV